MAMKLDHDDLDRLIEKISTSDIQEFSLEGEDFKLEIKRNLIDQNHITNISTKNNSLEKQTITSQSSSTDNITLTNNAEASQVPLPGLSDLTDITSPMVGTFYRAAALGDTPFVDLGSKVNTGKLFAYLKL